MKIFNKPRFITALIFHCIVTCKILLSKLTGKEIKFQKYEQQ